LDSGASGCGVGYRLRTAFYETGYLDQDGALTRVLLLTVETGKNLAAPSFAHIDLVTRQAGYDKASVVPDNVWNWAAAAFSWPDSQV